MANQPLAIDTPPSVSLTVSSYNASGPGIEKSKSLHNLVAIHHVFWVAKWPSTVPSSMAAENEENRPILKEAHQSFLRIAPTTTLPALEELRGHNLP